MTRAFHLREFAAGKGECTVEYLRWLVELYPDKKLLLLWDGASYHRDAQVQAYLTEVNAGLCEEEWRVTLLRFAPHAPEQNPVEDIWLQGKNHLRRQFAQNKTFAAVKHCFSHFLRSLRFESVKFEWYAPCPQIA